MYVGSLEYHIVVNICYLCEIFIALKPPRVYISDSDKVFEARECLFNLSKCSGHGRHTGKPMAVL